MTNSQILALKAGDGLTVGPLFKGLSVNSEIKLVLIEKVDGRVLLFDAFCFDVNIGEVKYGNGKWGWSS